MLIFFGKDLIQTFYVNYILPQIFIWRWASVING